eukprot:858471_1
MYTSGDLPVFYKADGASQKKCQHVTKATRKNIAKLNTSVRLFCAYFDGMMHQLEAPKFATKFIKNTGFYEVGSCKKLYGKKVKIDHEVEMYLVKNGDSVMDDDLKQIKGDDSDDDSDSKDKSKKKNKKHGKRRRKRGG